MEAATQIKKKPRTTLSDGGGSVVFFFKLAPQKSKHWWQVAGGSHKRKNRESHFYWQTITPDGGRGAFFSFFKLAPKRLIQRRETHTQGEVSKHCQKQATKKNAENVGFQRGVQRRPKSMEN